MNPTTDVIPDTISLDLPATYTALNILDVCITEMLANVEVLEDPGVVINDIRVAAQEACTMIVDHAYAHTTAGRIGVALAHDTTARAFVIDLHDQGRPCDFAAAQSGDSLPTDTATFGMEHSYSLFLLRALMDTVEYRSSAHGNHWHMIRYLR